MLSDSQLARRWVSLVQDRRRGNDPVRPDARHPRDPQANIRTGDVNAHMKDAF